jgi:hypothetical protein
MTTPLRGSTPQWERLAYPVPTAPSCGPLVDAEAEAITWIEVEQSKARIDAS